MSNMVSVVSLEALRKQIEGIESDLILLVVDSNVYNLYRKEFDFIKFKDKKVHLWKCLEGENTKVYDELKHALEFFLSKGVHRKAHLVAFGGGACSDFAGLVASMLLRGIKWSVVPTTLLSMIDASIGGKVAINSEYGKNLVGAFHLPENIFFYYDFLKTLDTHNMKGGKGELLKYCFLDRDIYQAVKDGAELNDVVQMCAKYKQKIVDEDFKEGDRRKILNLGHTIGHAIEKIYELPHGIAVCWGMVVIYKLFNLDESLIKMKILIEKLDLELGESPWFNKSFPVDDIMAYITKDKKAVSNDSIEVVLLEDIGQPVIKKEKFDFINNQLEQRKDELRKFIF